MKRIIFYHRPTGPTQKEICPMATNHEITLKLLESGTPISPETINTHAGKINCAAAQLICWLRKQGHHIHSERIGRRVVSYTLLSPGSEPPVETFSPKPLPSKPIIHRHQQPAPPLQEPTSPYTIDSDWDGDSNGHVINLRDII